MTMCIGARIIPVMQLDVEVFEAYETKELKEKIAKMFEENY